MGYELNKVMETYGVKTPAEKVTSGSIYNQPQFGYTGPTASRLADQTTSAARTTTGTSGTATGGGAAPAGAMQSIASVGTGAGQMTGTDFVKKLESMGLRDPSSGFADKYTVIGDTLFEKKFDPTTGRELAYQIRYDENDQPQIVYAGTPGGENIPSWASGATPGFTPTAERPGNKPSVKDLMDRGASFEDASSLLYGVVGSNRDVRDWNAIMASNDPLATARAATNQMYSPQGGQFLYSPEYLAGLKPASEWDAAAAQRGYAEGGEVQAYQQGGRQGDGITMRRIEDDPVLEGAAGAIDRVRAAERDVAPITIEDPFARENDLRALLESYAPQADYSGQLAEAKARRKAEFDAFANMIAGQADPEADKASKAEMYFRLAAAFGSPTKTGAFGENLALAAGEMADVSAGRRKSLAERAARQAELQKLRYQMAGEDLETLREAQAAGATGQRAIAQKLVEDYIASGRPQSEAGKIARDMGLQMGTPEHAAFVEDYTRTKMEKELAALQIQQQAIGRMPTAMVNLKVETEDKVNSLTQAMSALEEAYARNANSYSGSALDQMQYGALSMLGSDAPKVINTRIIENLLGEQALGQLKATFGAAPTEGERKILMDLQGIGAKSLEERGEIMLRLYQILQQRRDREAARLQEITQGSYGFYEPSTQGE